MLVVACRAAYSAGRLKAAAPFQKSHLVPVNVHLGVGCRPLQLDEGVERFSRPERKCWSDFFSQTSMALGTDIDLPVAGKFAGINDSVRSGPRGRRCRRMMAGDMLLARTVASLTRNSQNKIRLIVAICKRRGSQRLKVSRVTFDAAGNHRPVKICRTVQISGTVNPPPKFNPIRNGEFEKLIFLPIQIGLALSAGADHEAKRLCVFLGVRRRSGDRGFIKTAVSGVHSKREAGIDRFHRVFRRREFSCDGVNAWKLGCTVVCR